MLIFTSLDMFSWMTFLEGVVPEPRKHTSVQSNDGQHLERWGYRPRMPHACAIFLTSGAYFLRFDCIFKANPFVAGVLIKGCACDFAWFHRTILNLHRHVSILVTLWDAGTRYWQKQPVQVRDISAHSSRALPIMAAGTWGSWSCDIYVQKGETNVGAQSIVEFRSSAHRIVLPAFIVILPISINLV